MAKPIDDVRAMSDKDIKKDLAVLREEFFMRRFTADPKRIENPGKYRDIRRTIARYLTVLNERAREAAAQEQVS